MESISWNEVGSYYLELNDRYYGERKHHLEPVMLDAQGQEIFRGFAHLLVSTRRIIEQRHGLWQFVESHLEGKKREKPAPTAIEPSIFQTDWTQKSQKWKIGRVVAIISYALLWSGILSWLALDWFDNAGRHSWLAKFLSPLFFIPLIPHLVWLWMKKKTTARQLKESELSR